MVVGPSCVLGSRWPESLAVPRGRSWERQKRILYGSPVPLSYLGFRRGLPKLVVWSGRGRPLRGRAGLGEPGAAQHAVVGSCHLLRPLRVKRMLTFSFAETDNGS